MSNATVDAGGLVPCCACGSCECNPRFFEVESSALSYRAQFDAVERVLETHSREGCYRYGDGARERIKGGPTQLGR